MKPIKAAMLSIYGQKLTSKEKYLLEKTNPMGVTLFARNIKNPIQVRKLTDKIKEVIGREDVLIAVDQEGGRVCRLKPPYFQNYASQRAIGQLDDNDRKRMSFLQARLISKDLRECGINLNYAPCVDVLHETTGKVLKSRCFSDDEKIVQECAAEAIKAYKKSGIISCIKHVPGHGLAQIDPHLNLPIINEKVTKLEKDFYPFKKLKNLTPMMMTAHIVLSKIDDKPITYSKKAITNIIRKRIGFNGFLISDAIDMKALKGSLAYKVKNSIDAGCDAVCYCLGNLRELEEIAAVLPPLSDLSLERFEKLKNIINQKSKLTKIEQNQIEYEQLYKKTPIIKDDYDSVEILNILKGGM